VLPVTLRRKHDGQLAAVDSRLSGPRFFGPVELLVVVFVVARLRGVGLDGTGDDVFA
jgi:hypothetical protein